jgi:transposase
MNEASKKLPMRLLPKVPGLRLENTTIDSKTLMLTLASTSASAVCPICGWETTRLHSHYQRVMADLPWGGRSVRLLLEVRRFRCPEPECQRQVFAERLPELVEPYARKTTRLHEILSVVGFALGGEAGARLIARLGMIASPATLLRYIRQAAVAQQASPTVVGVDDFALRRGHRYGTIIVDLEEHRPIELLPDRSAPTLAAWLEEHPGLHTISRDRSTEYARGIEQGAPEVVEVLDRWHLLKNLRESVERMLNRNQQSLSGIRLPASVRTYETTASSEPADYAPAPRSPSEQAERQARRERRYARYTEVRRLHAEGMSLRAIGKELGISRYLVQRYAKADAFPEHRPHSPRPSMLDPFEKYLEKRWEQGCHNGLQLWRELCEMGYTGSRKRVAQWAQKRRKEPAPSTPSRYLHSEGHEEVPTSEGDANEQSASASVRRLSWLLVREPEQLCEAESAALAQMLRLCRDVRVVYPLAQEFVRMVREREAGAFEPWLEETLASGAPDFENFGAGLRRERAAVEAALCSEYSNGQTEGQINKLKLIKRQMYGRANFDLLRQRVLGAA